MEPTLEQVISLRRASAPTVSPDGRFVDYAVRDTDWVGNAFVTQVWLADSRDGTTRQLLFGQRSDTASEAKSKERKARDERYGELQRAGLRRAGPLRLGVLLCRACG